MATTEPGGLQFGYLKTHTAIAKISQAILNAVSILCVLIEDKTSEGDAFVACGFITLIITLLLIICNVANLPEKIILPWNYIDFGCCLFSIVFYMATATLILRYKDTNGYVIGGAFGFINIYMYGVNLLITYKKM
ncbi:hypothetical protein RN001_008420 [Aquatica leii]|uniref:MARVEL domain-containing protein n=1 Tax=Aquatica leii TaxID=1421715 RepID=A0AAN7SH92_9COLE|nr:hypothetical protein RN001_008420 [Aquatica leii]